MKSVRVAGMFTVALDVWDQNANTLTDVSSQTTGTRNVVLVKNICTHPKDVQIKVSLPNGLQSLEFVVAGSSQDRWEDDASQIANKGTNTLACELKRNGGPVSHNEPIQLDELLSRHGPHQKFVAVNSTNIPFRTTINAI
ncbi:hypothetical protein IVB12_07935 [Bradyrhizobium sp. 179]|uniref:hypothetical protein n=1 Tax=Bradyrhizobium sp. 179 TaxID=2782648 RepID=UPI001FF77809|nr:hypothetical protein [Bradyrhizobium sp. 179]MCK1541903.1 hypothetical protein [Bradyrhizobium sp. 179]